MKCINCARIVEDHFFYCPVCGANLVIESYSKSAFCWGGNGYRYHKYRYQGMNIRHIDYKMLSAQASYPVHWNQWMFYTLRNTLVISKDEQEQTLTLSHDTKQIFLPVIVPPSLYLLPCSSLAPPIKINILNLINGFQANSLQMGIIQEAGPSIQVKYHLAPAVWFDPTGQNPLQLITFWEGQELRLWDVACNEIITIHNFHGLLDSVSNTPCFDENANMWFRDNTNHKLIEFRRENDYQPLEHSYAGILSAPVYTDGEIYFYRTLEGVSELMRHPQTPIVHVSGVNPESIPQHVSQDALDHPAYQFSYKVNEASLCCELNPAVKTLIHPVWIQRNNFNAMILAYRF